MSNKYINYSLDEIFPSPPSPPLQTYSIRENKKIDDRYEKEMEDWHSGFDDWKKRMDNNIIRDRFEILDL